MATFTFSAAFNGTMAGTAEADTFIWPGPTGSIDQADTFFGAAGVDTLRLDGAITLTFAAAYASQWMAGIDRILVNNTGDNGIIIGATAGAPDAGAITMVGGAGNDLFDISARVAGYSGVFEGAGGNDRFLGSGGDDLFRPGTGADTFAGFEGNDTVEFVQNGLLGIQEFGSADLLAGGSGVDMLRFSGDAPAYVVLSTTYLRGFEVFDFRGMTAGATIGGIESYPTDGDAITVLGGEAGVLAVFNYAPFATTRVSMFGGSGSDRMLASGAGGFFDPGSGADTFEGFAGSGGADTVSLALSNLDWTDLFIGYDGFDVIRLTSGGLLTAAKAALFAQFELLELGPGGIDLTLWKLPVGEYGRVPVLGGAGHDRIDARAMIEAAQLDGGAGQDTVFGSNSGSGRPELQDTLLGGAGSDRLYGLAGRDRLDGGSDNDLLDGGADHDTLSGDFGNDRLLGGLGNDLLLPGYGADTVLGGAGDDFVTMLMAQLDPTDSLAGGFGSDTLYLDADDDSVTLDEAERISGFERLQLTNAPFIDRMRTVALGNTIVGDGGLRIDITLAGGSNTRYVIDGSAVTEAGFTVFASNDAVADTLIGGAGDDTLDGGDGNDAILGGTGNDQVTTRLSNADTIDAGAGDDTLVFYWSAADQVAGQYQGGAGRDVLRIAGSGFAMPDGFLTRFAGFDGLLLPDAPNDLRLTDAGLPAGLSAFSVEGGADLDFVDGSAVTTAALTLFGYAGDDELVGGARGDVLNGGTGTDVIQAGAGNDTVALMDVAGDDFADGGAGVDHLILNIGPTRAPAGFLSGFTGFEELTLLMGSGRVTLPAGFSAGSGGVLRVNLSSDGTQGLDQLNAASQTVRLLVREGFGNTNIIAGRSNDTIEAGLGGDRVQGGLGADSISIGGDGDWDRVVYATANDGSRDIFAAAAQAGTLAQADTILGFAGTGDHGDQLELLRAGFVGVGNKAKVASLLQGASIDLSSGAVFLLDAGDAVLGGFASRSGIHAAFGSRVLAGDAGQGAFVLARGGGTDAALYYLRDVDGLAGLSDADVLQLLAVLVNPGAITASEILLV
jgi:Ca2+-binding RTX toxin-like protein